MNKFNHQTMMKNSASDKNSDVSSNLNEAEDLSCNYSLIDIDELNMVVIAAAKETFHTLGSGLPICVYQLKLFNVLTKNGLKLTSAKSVLNDRAEPENIKNLIIINDALIIEYVSIKNIKSQNEKIIKTYLHENNYAVGLLVKIKQDDIEISIIDQYYIAH